MPDQELLDGLIATYRELNAEVRPLPEERLQRRGEGGSVRELVARLRDRELRFSQALRERLTGVPMAEIFDEHEIPVLGTEGAHDSTAALISQFGTAREATLAMLRALPEAEWDRAPAGEQPIGAEARQLHDNDRRQLARIKGLIGRPGSP